MSTYFNTVWRKWLNLEAFEKSPLNANAVVNEYWVAGSFSDQMRTPRYARFGRHVRYRLSDVVDWEAQQFADAKRTSA
jgi:hypothetical protein